jgi:hypothetical protein
LAVVAAAEEPVAAAFGGFDAFRAPVAGDRVGAAGAAELDGGAVGDDGDGFEQRGAAEEVEGAVERGDFSPGLCPGVAWRRSRAWA